MKKKSSRSIPQASKSGSSKKGVAKSKASKAKTSKSKVAKSKDARSTLAQEKPRSSPATTQGEMPDSIAEERIIGLPQSASREAQMMKQFAAGFRATTFSATDIESALLICNDNESIEQLVGKDYASQLRQLASEANQNRVSGGPRVLILPGFFGSSLAVGNDTVWLNVHDIMQGRFRELSLDEGAENTVSTSGFWPTYLELKLKLRKSGYQAEYFHYDWRKSIVEAGQRLASQLEETASQERPISMVAHGMGGLVARAALKLLGDKSNDLIHRLVLLGTPNFGFYAPSLILANDHSTVHWLNCLDFVSVGNSIVRDTISTFVGLMEMIPEPSNNNGVDLFQTDSYPSQLNFARADVLQSASGLQGKIAPGTGRIWMIAGTGLDTVVGLDNTEDPKRFTQMVSNEGDGTVPLRLAMLPNAEHRFCKVAHASMPSNDEVIRATLEILATGTTDLLAASSNALVRPIPPKAIRNPVRSDDIATNEAEAIPRIDLALAPFLSVSGEPSAAPRGDDFKSNSMSKKPIIIGRKFQNRLDLTLMHGDVTQARGRALMLGVFKDVRPGGAALAVDSRIGGVLAEVIERRMFSANVGEVFIIPTVRQNIGTELVALIGLGSFSMFTAKSLRSSVENATRTLLRCNVDDLVTVPMGGGTGMPIRVVSEAILDGVQAAIRDARDRISLRGLTIATNSGPDFEQMCNTALELAASSQFDGMEFTIDRRILETTADRSAIRSGVFPGANSCYMIVREIPSSHGAKDKMRHLDVSFLGISSKAAVISDEIVINEDKLEELLKTIAEEKKNGGQSFLEKLPEHGKKLSELVLPPLVREALTASVEASGTNPEKQASLTVINDFWSSKIPWEILSIGNWQASIQGNVSRRYSTSNMSVAKWLHERRQSSVCRMLLIVDPTEDLGGAVEEASAIKEGIAEVNREYQGDRIGSAIKQSVLELGKIEITEIRGTEATKAKLLNEFSSGKYDVVHYAGHADFNENSRSQSGIICAGNVILTGRELAMLENLPTLMIFNACESARTRGFTIGSAQPSSSPAENTEATETTTVKLSEVIDRSVSFAEAFLRGGVGSFVGTYWPVRDAGAAMFAKEFYGALLSKSSVSIGEALRAARAKLQANNEPDYANYIHYGDPEFRVKV